MTEIGTYHLYNDICERTGGEIYIGVVGPVRTGKSTFIKRFMEVMVLPKMEEGPEKVRAIDELPQSGDGRTITTTEPKFIPSKAARIELEQDITVSLRLVDCVGYMVEGASGAMEEERERLVTTPWDDNPVPFRKAADIGTNKVIEEHATVGIILTTDGSIGTDMNRKEYEKALQKTIQTMQGQNKPYVVIVNTIYPNQAATLEYCKEIENTYHIICFPMNCKEMNALDIRNLFYNLLQSFPVEQVCFYLPKWFSFLPKDHPYQKQVKEMALEITQDMDTMQDVLTWQREVLPQKKDILVKETDMSRGKASYDIALDESAYYELISEWFQKDIPNETSFLQYVRELSQKQNDIRGFFEAIHDVSNHGYGIVKPRKEQITIEKPVLIRQGNKYGVKLVAKGPSMHLIRAFVETEIAPIVGDKEQAEDLVAFIEKNNQEDAIWDTSIFGKTILQLVEDGMNAKIAKIEEESQLKLQDSMQKIVNESNGGMICIII